MTLTQDVGNTRARIVRTLSDPARAIPLLLVAIAVVFNLVSLRSQTIVVEAANDGPQHVAMIQWAQERISSGHVPLDGWYPFLGFGSPHFHHYQSFPHAVAGLFATVFGAAQVYTWSLYLLLSLWPLCVYWSGRLFGANRWTSSIAALVALLVVSDPINHIGFEFGAYTRGGYGVWAQLWGMWLLPLTLALAWRAVNRKGSFLWPSVALAFLLASHFLTAYLGLLVIGAWALVSFDGIWTRLRRTLLVTAGGLLVGAWAVAPPVLDARWASRQEWLLNTFYTDSYGPGKVLRWLVTGKLFDAGRTVPLITLLVAVGIVVCIASWSDLRARAVLYLFALSLVLYMGRDVVGIVLDRLPIGEDILLHRYIMGVHLGGIFLAGVGAAWLGARAVQLVPRFLFEDSSRRGILQRPEVMTAAVVVVGLVLLIPAWRERWSFNASSADAIARQRIIERGDGRDVLALIERAKKQGGGRIYSGVSEQMGEQYRVGGAQVYKMLASHAADGVGYIERTLSLPQNVERQFNESNPAHYELFNVRYVLLDRPTTATSAGTIVEQRGRHTLWDMKTSGYLDVVDTQGTVSAGRADLGHRMTSFMQSFAPLDRRYPTVAFEGDSAARPSVTGRPPEGEPGRVAGQFARLSDGVFGGEIVAERDAVVLLKASFDPRWRVTVDGERVAPQMIAPAFVGAPVDRGRHTVRFVYDPLPWYPALFAVSLIALLVLALGPRFAARRRAEASDGTPRLADG